VLYIEGGLEERERSEIDGHLVDCRRCAEATESLSRLIELLKRAGRGHPGPPADCRNGESLAAYADGSLGSAEARAFELHLAACPACLAELADLWRLAGAPTHDVRDEVVERVLRLLRAEGARARVRWVERSLTLMRDFGGRVVQTLPAAEPVPVLARAGAESIRLRWSGEGSVCDLVLRMDANGPSVTGRLTDDAGRPESAISVGLRSKAGDRAPETPDGAGRFGPWPLNAGENTITLAGTGIGEGVELTITMERADVEK